MSVVETNLTESQAERRARVLHAATELGTAGGYDAVQIRAVAARAGVALGTVYHYFDSKDHLLAALMVDWVAAFKIEIEADPPTADRLADRVVELLSRAHAGMQSDEAVAAAVVKALSSPGPEVASCQYQLHHEMTEVLSIPFPPGFDDQTRMWTIRTIEHVWFSTLVGAVMGWTTFETANEELEHAAHLLLDHHDL